MAGLLGKDRIRIVMLESENPQTAKYGNEGVECNPITFGPQ